MAAWADGSALAACLRPGLAHAHADDLIDGYVRVQYKDWRKVDAERELVDGGQHPCKDRGIPVITTGMSRKPKPRDQAPALIMHTIASRKVSVVHV